MAIGRITKRAVDALEPSSRDIFLWDEDLSGFGLRVTPSGHKTYVVQGRIPGLGRRGFAKRIALGEHGILTPEEARRLARQELGKVAHGTDPAADRAARRDAVGMEMLGAAYLEDVRMRHKQRAADEYRRLWERHVVPPLGSGAAPEVTVADVRRLHRSLHETPYIANRVLALLGAFFTYAIREGVRPQHDNPAHGVEFYPEKARERFLTPAEFGRLGEALARAECQGLPPAPGDRRKRKDPKTAKHRPKRADQSVRGSCHPTPCDPAGRAGRRPFSRCDGGKRYRTVAPSRFRRTLMTGLRRCQEVQRRSSQPDARIRSSGSSHEVAGTRLELSPRAPRRGWQSFSDDSPRTLNLEP